MDDGDWCLLRDDCATEESRILGSHSSSLLRDATGVMGLKQAWTIFISVSMMNMFLGLS
jgi:hypothetical protein